MIGVYDFCGHYEWTFAWLEQEGGHELVKRFWDEAIAGDSQIHAAILIQEKGIDGMKEYWGHSLSQEAAGYSAQATDEHFRLDIHSCPSKGFLLDNKLEQYGDYCDHCMGWIGPMMKRAGFVVDHEHNHRGRCWWKFRKAADDEDSAREREAAAENDVRNCEDWSGCDTNIDCFRGANDPDDKQGKST